MRIYYKVTLTEQEIEELINITQQGKHSSQKVINALILLNCNETSCPIDNKPTSQEIAKTLNISVRKVERVKKRFIDDGLEAALNGKPSDRVYEKKIDGDAEAHLIAMSCSEPPEGFSRWTLRLLSGEMVKLEYIESISHEAVRQVLKKTN